MNYEAGGFVDDEQVLVLEQHVEMSGFGVHWGAAWLRVTNRCTFLGNTNGNDVANDQPRGGARDTHAIPGDLAQGDPALNARARRMHIREAPAEGQIESLPGVAAADGKNPNR